MVVIENPVKHQCALFKSSRKHYEKAIEDYASGKTNIHGQLTAATETAEAGEDMELYGWLAEFKAGFDSAGTLDTAIATNIAIRYNAYNQICGWGLEDFDPNQPLIIPGGGGVVD
ncbi:MAG: hypothetical protein KAR56_00765 [Thermoplasmata archaeon]|nr:hypothetical protein [Thermoplasmata archaeon]